VEYFENLILIPSLIPLVPAVDVQSQEKDHRSARAHLKDSTKKPQ